MSLPATLVRLGGDPVALVCDGQAWISHQLEERTARTVKAMCLFALEVQAGNVDPPYSDRRALAYARLTTTERTTSEARSN